MRLIDLRDQRFGSLVVVDREPPSRRAKWICRCDCGATHRVAGDALRSGRVVSCGCVNRMRSRERLISWMEMNPEVHAETGRRNMTRLQAALTPRERSEKSSRARALVTREQLQKAGRASMAARSPEERHDLALRGAAASVAMPKELRAQRARRSALSRRMENPGYAAVHDRLQTDRGKAGMFECADCGGRAEEWSYEGEGSYSADLTLYVARCVPCHRRRDAVASSVRVMPQTPGKRLS